MAHQESVPNKLSKRDLAAIQNYLAKVTHKWTDIGVQLQMDPDYLEKLRSQPNSSDNNNCRQMILTWLNGKDPVPTWKALCKALRAPAVEEEALAHCIEEERLPIIDSEVEGSAVSASHSSVRVRSDLSVPSDEEDEEPQSNTEEDTTEALLPHLNQRALEPFPYLHTSGLSAKEKEALLERLLQESAATRLAFTSLVSNTEASLQSREIDGAKIQSELKSGNFNHHSSYLAENSAENDTKSMSLVMGKLNECWNFCDYTVLEHIILRLGTLEDRGNLEEYKQSLADFAQRRAFECPRGSLGASIGENEEALTIKSIDKRTLLHDITLNQVLIFSAILKKELDIEDSDMRLISHQRDKRSLILSFGVFTPVANAVFPLQANKKERLISLGVWFIKCREYIFEQEHQSGIDEPNAGILSDNGESEDMEIEGTSMEESTSNNQIILLHCNVSTKDEDMGTHTSISINNKNLVIEVNSCSKSTYKSYKVSKQREGSLQWLSGAKGTRYGMGKAPKIALTNEGFVVEVDEETNGYISYRVGLVHSSHMMIWTESSIFTAGSNPSVAICHDTVIAAFKRAEDAFYRTGTLNTDSRSISWSTQEHRFVNGISDLDISSNHDGTIVAVFTKTLVSSSLSSLYSVVGTLSKLEKRVLFSSAVSSSQSISEGTFPSVSVSQANNVIVTYVQEKTGIKRTVKYKHGRVKKALKSNDYGVVWSEEEGVFDLVGVKASVSMNDKGSVLISHSTDGEGFCHIGKLYCETTI